MDPRSPIVPQHVRRHSIEPTPRRARRPGVAVRMWACSACALFAVLLTAAGCANRAATGSSQEIATPPPPPPAPTEPLGRVEIELPWGVQDYAQRNRIYGFNVYRSANAAGPFKRVNADPLTPSPEEPNPASIVFNDRGLPQGSTQHYFVTALLRTGREIRLAPAQPQQVVLAMSAEEVQAWWESEWNRRQAPAAATGSASPAPGSRNPGPAEYTSDELPGTP